MKVEASKSVKRRQQWASALPIVDYMLSITSSDLKRNDSAETLRRQHLLA